MPHPVFLVRHGEVHNPDHIVYADLPGFSLSSRGRRQAGETGDRLADRSVAVVATSPLERARETAVAIAARHDLEVTIDPELTEWGLARQWRGLAWESVETHHPGQLTEYLDHPWDLAWNPEPLEQLAFRMTTAIERLAARAHGALVVVSHQDPIQAARLALTHRTLRGLNVDKPRHAEVFELMPGTPWREVGRWAPTEQVDFPPPSART